MRTAPILTAAILSMALATPGLASVACGGTFGDFTARMKAEAMSRGLKRYGVGSGAAHLISGHSRAHHALEEELAGVIGDAAAHRVGEAVRQVVPLLGQLLLEHKAQRVELRRGQTRSLASVVAQRRGAQLQQ